VSNYRVEAGIQVVQEIHHLKKRKNWQKIGKKLAKNWQKIGKKMCKKLAKNWQKWQKIGIDKKSTFVRCLKWRHVVWSTSKLRTAKMLTSKWMTSK
jgi:coenzyme F420-reducing hydrogenase beta subunit